MRCPCWRDGCVRAGCRSAGKDEVLAGSQAPHEDQLNIAGCALKVVGVLQPSVGLFSDSYYPGKKVSHP